MSVRVDRRNADGSSGRSEWTQLDDVEGAIERLVGRLVPGDVAVVTVEALVAVHGHWCPSCDGSLAVACTCPDVEPW